MKNLKNKMLIALAVLSATSAVNAATVSDRVTGTADIVFNQPANPLTITLTPEAGLVAGEYAREQKVVNFNVTSTNPAVLGVTFTQGLASQAVGGSTAVVNGISNPENKLSIILESLEQNDQDMIGNELWALSPSDVKSFTGDIYALPGQIAADTYRISLDAAVYNP